MAFQNFSINVSELKKKLNVLTSVFSDLSSNLNQSFAEFVENISKNDEWVTHKDINDFSSSELRDLLKDFNKCDYHIFYDLQDLIQKKINLEWVSTSIRNLEKIIKNLIKQRKSTQHNKRDFIRKICCFNFKNLDDTHSIIVFN